MNRKNFGRIGKTGKTAKNDKISEITKADKITERGGMPAYKKADRCFAFCLQLPMLLWGLVFVLAALLYIFRLSFLTRGDLVGVKNVFTLSNYTRLFSEEYAGVLLLSLKQAVITTVLCLLIGYPFGYFLAGMNKKAQSVVMLLLIVPFWTNALIRLYGWRILLQANGPLNSALLALGLITEPLKLLYSEGAVLLGSVYALLPFMILPAFNSVEKLDRSAVDAARDLGASPLTAFLTVTVPLTLPGLLAGCVLVFIPSMGLFFINDLLGGSKIVLAGGLIQQLINSRDLPMAAALCVLLLSLTGIVIAAYHKAGGDNTGLF